MGATVLEIPSIEVRPPRTFRALDHALLRLREYDWLILTSVNGVEALFQRLKKLRLKSRQLEHLRIAAIGPATRAAITRRGLRVHVMPDDYVAEAVVHALRKRVQGKQVLLVRARVARDVIPRELRRAGAKLHVREAYRTVLPPSSKPRLRAVLQNPRRRPHAITFTSSSTARNFLRLLGPGPGKKLRGIRLASIGPVTSATMRALGLPVHVQAKQYTMQGLVKALVQDWRSKSRRN